MRALQMLCNNFSHFSTASQPLFASDFSANDGAPSLGACQGFGGRRKLKQ